MTRWLIFFKLPTARRAFCRAASRDIWMDKSMILTKAVLQERWRKTKWKGREAARRTDAGAQGQENASQEEGRTTSASAGEDMQADIVKRVITNWNWKTFLYYFPVPSCRKKKSRRYLEENGCRSKRLLSQKLCKGSCHDGTCCKVKG